MAETIDVWPDGVGDVVYVCEGSGYLLFKDAPARAGESITWERGRCTCFLSEKVESAARGRRAYTV